MGSKVLNFLNLLTFANQIQLVGPYPHAERSLLFKNGIICGNYTRLSAQF